MLPACPTTLTEAINCISDAHYANESLPAAWRKTAADLFASRQGLAGSYSRSFLGIGDEVRAYRLYTGELATSASARHLIGQESCRALRLLKLPSARTTLEKGEAALREALERAWSNPGHRNPGLFCCGQCTVGLWRSLIAGAFDRQEERLAAGIAHLASIRTEKPGWRRFPFWYTVLALAEAPLPEARRELSRVEASLRRAANGSPSEIPARRRRQALAKRALG